MCIPSVRTTADDTLLIIEISVSTLRYDRDIKLPLYARHGIPEVWILDLNGGRVLFHRSPSPEGTYAERSVTSSPGQVELAALPGVVVDLSAVIGR